MDLTRGVPFGYIMIKIKPYLLSGINFCHDLYDKSYRNIVQVL